MDEYQPEFNGSVDTLQRISELLRDASDCRVNHQWVGWQNNLLQTYKEGYDWLTKEEQKNGELLFTLKAKLDQEGENVLITEEDILTLDRYEITLRVRLKKAGLTFKQKDLETRYDKIRKNYGLKPKTNNTPERV